MKSDRKAENQKGAEKRKAEQKREADQKAQQRKQDAAKLDAAAAANSESRKRKNAPTSAGPRPMSRRSSSSSRPTRSPNTAARPRGCARSTSEQSSSLKSRDGEAIDRHWHDVKTIDDRERQALKEFDVKRASLTGRAAELIKGKAHFDGRREEMQKKFEIRPAPQAPRS